MTGLGEIPLDTSPHQHLPIEKDEVDGGEVRINGPRLFCIMTEKCKKMKPGRLQSEHEAES